MGHFIAPSFCAPSMGASYWVQVPNGERQCSH